MDCKEFKKVSGGYLEDAVPPDMRRQVEDHLVRCPLCAAVMNQMKLLRERLRLALCKDCCPGNLRHRVTRKLRMEAFKHRLAQLFGRTAH